MKAKNTPFDMDDDDVAMLAMAMLRGSGRLNDKKRGLLHRGLQCMYASVVRAKTFDSCAAISPQRIFQNT